MRNAKFWVISCIITGIAASIHKSITFNIRFPFECIGKFVNYHVTSIGGDPNYR